MNNPNIIWLTVLNCCGLPIIGAIIGSAVTFIITRGYRLRLERRD